MLRFTLEAAGGPFPQVGQESRRWKANKLVIPIAYNYSYDDNTGIQDNFAQTRRPPEEFSRTLERWLEALNFISRWAWKKKEFNYGKLQKALYRKVREKFGLKSQMTVNSFRQVSAGYRSTFANRRKKGRKPVRIPVEFKNDSLLLNYPRDWKFKDGETLSLNTLEGRKPVRFSCGGHQRKYLDNGWVIGSGRLVRRKRGRGKGLYFNISVTREFEVGDIEDRATVVGVDLGINNIAVAKSSNGEHRFFEGGETKNRKRMFERTRGSLQAKGTRSAKRTLKRLSGRERRFMADVNHRVSKELVEWVSTMEKPVMALENLEGIRERVNRESGKKTRKAVNRWAYHQLRTFIAYKANALGIPVVLVSPRNTSRECPRCGYTEKDNRKGRSFKCLSCGYGNNSDLVAAGNTLSKATSSRQVLEEAGRSQPAPKGRPSMPKPLLGGIEAEGRPKLRPSGQGS
ncbi:MAG: transposase [Actinobacteria bacterium]|nr:transposase [Actinomycetota bacterium]MBU4490150.1 transposase [Actinomycetota bacterium]